MNLVKLFGMLRAHRAGAPLGDVVVLKLDALSGVSNEVARKLEPVRGWAPTHDLPALRRLPAGTLGREYARFLDDNGRVPLEVSPAVRERFRENPYALRYTATHDLHHVLAGFDTSLAGEAGVLAFNVGQRTAPVGRWALWIVRLLYTLIAPWQARSIARNLRDGLAMGRAAELVMAAPLESWFEEPLEDVRAKLRLPAVPARAAPAEASRPGLRR
jgi:ubiquinone biosynthesis protein Coq4